MPQVAPVVLIPALSLVGASSDPAILEGYGPISIDVAKRLLANAPSFYRAFTDPFTGEPLALNPDTRKVSKKMRIMLRAANEFCTFPGCTTKAAHAEQDHLTPWELGGKTIEANLEPLDKRHHLLKHFKDDRTRQGQRRTNQTPERAAMKLRGWTPTMTPSGVPGWTSPAGRYYAPQPTDIDAPSYPKWLAKRLSNTITHSMVAAAPTSDSASRGNTGQATACQCAVNPNATAPAPANPDAAKPNAAGRAPVNPGATSEVKGAPGAPSCGTKDAAA
ncbi:MAG: HNH endonuclease signature motif containing protein [Specibacter sp.]